MTADSWLRATIAGLELFRGLPDEVLAAVTAQAKPATFRAGEALMRRGDPPESVHVLLRGRVRVELPHPGGEPTVLAVLGPGEVVGEMGVLDREPRAADVLAMRDTETVELVGVAGVAALLEQPQIAVALLRALSRRLRETDELVGRLAPLALHRRGHRPWWRFWA